MPNKTAWVVGRGRAEVGSNLSNPSGPLVDFSKCYENSVPNPGVLAIPLQQQYQDRECCRKIKDPNIAACRSRSKDSHARALSAPFRIGRAMHAPFRIGRAAPQNRLRAWPRLPPRGLRGPAPAYSCDAWLSLACDLHAATRGL